jgi:hypothetical protein
MTIESSTRIIETEMMTFEEIDETATEMTSEESTGMMTGETGRTAIEMIEGTIVMMIGEEIAMTIEGNTGIIETEMMISEEIVETATESTGTMKGETGRTAIEMIEEISLRTHVVKTGTEPNETTIPQNSTVMLMPEENMWLTGAEQMMPVASSEFLTIALSAKRAIRRK